MQIIKKSIDLAPDGGYVIMLLRLNFFGSKDRFPFFEEFMPKYCYVHHKRISFIPESTQKQLIANGEKRMSSDSIEYAHYVWQKGFETEFTKLKVI